MKHKLATLIATLVIANYAQAQQSWHSVSSHVDFVQQSEKLRFYDSNQALIQGEKCALLVDAPGEFSQTEAFVTQLKAKLTVPLCYLVASHAHDDHLLGLAMVQQQFPDAQLVVHEHLGASFHRAHEQLNQRLDGFAKSIALSEQRMDKLPEPEQAPWQEKINRAQIRLKQWQSLKFTSPQLVVAQPQTLDLGNLSAQVMPFSAHTDGDLAVLVVQDKVLVGADIVDTLPYPGEGNFNVWIKTLADFAALPVESVLPGHGELLQRDDLHIPEKWLKAIYTHVQANPSMDLAALVESFPKDFESKEEGLTKRAYAMFLEAGIKRAKQLVDKSE
ncbi:MBL fold metallo-hydrolase [Pseudoalteromonas pernae]|uniref:MBL fold metallo-hydrolase n=1 Tax=Pseudoalteromonas pernae TaxID=3118054 RepID=UPI0032422209